MVRKAWFLSFFMVFFFPPQVFGQLWSGVISPSRAVNWSNAGATIATSRTQCGSTIAPYGSSASAASAATINAALAACPANGFVLLGSGTFYLNTTISPGNGSGPANNVTLRGSGANSTFLIFSGQGSAPYDASYCSGFNICGASSDSNAPSSPSNTATWSAGYTQGATSITLSSAANLSVGSPIILDQIDTQSDNGALYVGCELFDGSSDCYSGAGPNSYERGDGAVATIRGQQQMVQVTSISGSGPYTVGITPGLYASNWNSGQSPGAWWSSHPIQGFGIENMSIQPSGSAAGGIFLFNCQNCWVKDVVGNLQSSPGGSGWGQVIMQNCNHCTVRDSYFYGNVSVDNYVVAVEGASDLLVENNIFQFPGTAQFYNSDCEGCVADYNFSVNALYSSSSNWLAQSSDYHGTVMFALSEGNIGTGLYADSFHGTHDLDTQFRNRWDGKEQNNGNVTTSSTVAVRLNPGARYQNVIGNILGTPGYHTTYKSTVSGSNLYNSVVGCGAYPEASMPGDSLSCPTSLWWGNWDSVTNAVRWCGQTGDTGWSTTCGSSSEIPTSAIGYPNIVPTTGDIGDGQLALPASFIYASAPSWWPSGKAWPAIGPGVTGGNVGQCIGGAYGSSEATSSAQCTGGTLTPVAGGMVTSIPAMDCYLNIMGGAVNGIGAVLPFDSSLCYATTKTGSSPSPGAPLGLSATPIVLP